MASSSTKKSAKRPKNNKESTIEENHISTEDVEWLSSLSEPELDFLISLKELIVLRAKNAGHGYIAKKFDLKMLRSLGLVLLEYLKECVQGTSIKLDKIDTLALLNRGDLLSPKFVRKAASKTCDDDITKSSFVTLKPKRMWAGLTGEPSSCKKQKTVRKEK